MNRQHMTIRTRGATNAAALHPRRRLRTMLGASLLFAAIGVSSIPSGAAAQHAEVRLRTVVGVTSLADVIERAELGVVVVIAKDSTGQAVSQGSGFFIDEQHIVTNCHVVDEAAHIEVRLTSGKTYAVKAVVGDDDSNDLVLLRVDIPSDAGHIGLPLNAAEPRKGVNVIVLGSPRGFDFSVTRGIVSAVRPIEGMTSDRVIQIDAPVSPGNSGGPVLNEAGEVIGVASFVRTDGQNLNFAQGAWNVAALQPGEPQTIAQWVGSRAETTFRKAAAPYRDDLHVEAASLLTKVVRAQPSHRQAWFMLGYSLTQLGQHTDAIAAYQRHLRNGASGRGAAETLYNIGINYRRLDEPQRAEHAFLESLEHDATFQAALQQLGSLAWKQEQWDHVIRYYSRILELDPRDGAIRSDLSNAINNIGVEEYQQGRLRTAARRFLEAIEVNPENNRARLNLGLVAHDLDYLGTTRQMYEELLSRDPDLARELSPYLP